MSNNEQKPVPARLRGWRGSHRLKNILLALAGLLLVVLFARLVFEVRPWEGPERVAAFLRGVGPFAPFVYIALLAVAVMLPPVPDTVPMVIAGAGFGALRGGVYTMAGVMSGAAAAFYLARRFGRGLLERRFGKARLQKLDKYASNTGRWVLFTSNLIGLNTGVMSFAAGMTRMRSAAFLSATLLGALPQVALVVVSGRLLLRNSLAFLGVFAAIALLTGVARRLWRRAAGRRRLRAAPSGRGA